MYVSKTKQVRNENDRDHPSQCMTHVQLLSFVYAELVIADKKGIPYFEKFIHVTTARHVAFLVGSKLVSRTMRLLAFRWILGLEPLVVSLEIFPTIQFVSNFLDCADQPEVHVCMVFQICPRTSQKKLGIQIKKFLRKIRRQIFWKENFTCHEFEKKISTLSFGKKKKQQQQQEKALVISSWRKSNVVCFVMISRCIICCLLRNLIQWRVTQQR